MWKTEIWLWALDVVFPKKCLNCSQPGKYLCDDCRSLLNISASYETGKDELDYLFWAAPYRDKIVSAAIHLCKYRYVRELADDLSDLIIAYFNLLNNPPDSPFSSLPVAVSENSNGFALVSTPLHKKTLKKRGFNQSEEIARYLSEKSGIPLIGQALVKTKKTRSQMELDREERFKNVVQAFAINPQKIKDLENKKIILVDDVYTTGATMRECAKLLKQNRAREIWGVVVARD